MPEQSVLAQNLFFWAYHITIDNFCEETIQLTKRHWRIIDANGDVNEVKGVGVVGEMPILKPLDIYQYSSGAYLKTPSGIMMGTYTFLNLQTKQEFDVEIPSFSLDSPFETHEIS